MSNTLTHDQMRRQINDIRTDYRRLKLKVDMYFQSKADERIKQIAAVCAKDYGYETSILFEHNRKERIPEARAVAMVIIYKTMNLKIQQVADAFATDRCTFYHSMKTVKDRYELYNGFKAKFDGICEKLGVTVNEFTI